MWVRAKRGVDFEAATFTVPREREREPERSNISRLFLFSSLGICTFCISLSEGVRGEKKVRARARFFFDFSASSDDDEKPLVR